MYLIRKETRFNEFWNVWVWFFRFVKKKFEELYFQSTAPDRVDRVFKIYRTTALDQKLVKKTFKLVDETLRRRNLFEAGLLWRGGGIRNPITFSGKFGRKQKTGEKGKFVFSEVTTWWDFGHFDSFIFSIYLISILRRKKNILFVWYTSDGGF